jgi:hypothetical protein
MKVGDKVRVVGIPKSLPGNDKQTKQIFELCLDRIFLIKDIKQVEGLPYELVELPVGEVVGEADCMHSIWVEPEFLEKIDATN